MIVLGRALGALRICVRSTRDGDSAPGKKDAGSSDKGGKKRTYTVIQTVGVW